MISEMMALVVGMSIVFTFCLLSFAYVLRRPQILIPLLSVVVLIPFGLQGLQGEPTEINNPLLLFISLGLGLSGFLLYWPSMLKQVSEHVAQWVTLIGLTTVILINQLFINNLWLFCLPAFVLSSLALLQFVDHYRHFSELHDGLQEEIKAKTVAVGLDLATGLPNKLAFSDRVDKWLLINPEQQLNVVVFKFSHFSELNAAIGHQNADVVKVQLITRLKNILLNHKGLLLLSDSIDSAFMATLGGVEFTLAVNDNEDNFATEKLLNLLKKTIREPILVNATTVDIGIEFGVATYPEQGVNSEDLIEHAFIALNTHKATGSSVYFNKKLQKQLLSNRAVITQLREDLENKKFELYVQPQINLFDQNVVGGEVLIRWRRDDMGILDAAKFIELAEESGVIYPLSVWSLEQTIIKLAEIQQQGLQQYLAVNISNKELFHSQLVETVGRLIDKYQINAESLIFEIKESAFALNQNKALQVTRLLQQLGVKVALDDFGKDQSAVSAFNQFLPHYVKVDCRSLNMTKKGDKTNTYLNAIIGLAQSLKIPTIAQGIELESAVMQLKDINCQVGQGYIFSKPFELSGFDVWINQWQRQQTLSEDSGHLTSEHRVSE